MKCPPLLLGTTLLFWGWQAGFPVMGAVLAVVLEGAQIIRTRWELRNDDFTRIWNLCVLLFLIGAVYAFTSNEGLLGFLGLFREPSYLTQRNAGLVTARTAASLLRWLPMLFFPLMAAQAYSSRGGIPLEAISLLLRRRWQRARKLGHATPVSRIVDISYAYFGICLFAASIRANENDSFFWGVCVLVFWALWGHRSRRFGVATWVGALVAVISLGYLLVLGIRGAQRFIENANPQWFLSPSRRGFDPRHAKTMLGQIGRMKLSSQIVIRLESKEDSVVPKLLREASYRTYKGQTWFVGNTTKDFETVSAEPDGDTWVLVPGRTNAAKVRISSYLPGGTALLPLPRGSVRLEKLPAFILERNGGGSVRAQGPGLVIFDALSSPGASFDSPPDEREDLGVPPREAEALDQIISELQLRDKSRQEAMKSISTFFQRKFDYSIWQDTATPERGNETPLAHFLLRGRKGHCEYFATATVLLLRELKIPARYAVGYSVHEASGRNYVVRQRDAHAWCMVWNKQKQTWDDLDTTPGSWFEAEARRASPLQWVSDVWSRLRFEFSKFRWGQSQIRQYAIWTLAPVIALLLYQILFRSGKRRKQRKRGGFTDEASLPGVDSEFYNLERKLAAAGLERQLSEPLSQWLRRALADPSTTEVKDSLEELLRLHYRYRFDPPGLSDAERESLRTGAKLCLDRIGQD